MVYRLRFGDNIRKRKKAILFEFWGPRFVFLVDVSRLKFVTLKWNEIFSYWCLFDVCELAEHGDTIRWRSIIWYEAIRASTRHYTFELYIVCTSTCIWESDYNPRHTQEILSNLLISKEKKNYMHHFKGDVPPQITQPYGNYACNVALFQNQGVVIGNLSLPISSIIISNCCLDRCGRAA